MFIALKVKYALGALAMLAVVQALAANSFAAEFFPDGDFEIGNIFLEIARAPRYGSPNTTPAFIDASARMEGRNCLSLPGGKGQLYRLLTESVYLAGGQEYTFSFQLLAPAPCSINVQAFVHDLTITKIQQERSNYGKGRHTIQFHFVAQRKGGRHWLRILISPKGEVFLDSLSLVGPVGTFGPFARQGVGLESNNPLGVYRVGEQGSMKIRVRSGKEKITYRIMAYPSGSELANGELTVDDKMVGKLPLPTQRPGYFRIEVETGRYTASRAYAVITPGRGDLPPDPRFGICLEEHGGIIFINDGLQPQDIYALAHDMGAGSARLFSLAFPERLSQDGIRFDFSDLDAAVRLAHDHGLRVLIPLGSNPPTRAPGWLRTTREQGNVDLFSGAYTAKLKLLAQRQGGERYLDMAAYSRFLQKLLGHLKGKVEVFEVWNEPGHKFSIEDSMRLAEITRRARDIANPGAMLLGYSSTKGRGIGQGMDPRKDPGFLAGIAAEKGLNLIDGLSFHSGHAFLFMGRDFDFRNQQTGYVDRLRRIVARYDRSSMAIWDTERVMPWYSRGNHPPMAKSGYNDFDIDRAFSMLDVARQLPMIFAAELSDGVETIHWFYLDSSIGHIFEPWLRSAMHEINGEPTAMIPAYDAMTEMLHGAEYRMRLDKSDGNRAYAFARGDDTVLLAYNWLEKPGRLEIISAVPGSVYDVYGNKVGESVDGGGIVFDGWPVYVLFKGTAPEKLALK